MVCILLGEGFEEIEALTPCDLLRRAGVEVRLIGLQPGAVCGGHGIRVETDGTVDALRAEELQMLVLPGGLGGVKSLRESECAMALIRAMAEQGRYVAAICAAPTILAELGLLEGRLATCYPTMQNELSGAIVMQQSETVLDGALITATGVGAAIPFALQLITVLRGRETAERVAAEIVFRS